MIIGIHKKKSIKWACGSFYDKTIVITLVSDSLRFDRIS